MTAKDDAVKDGGASEVQAKVDADEDKGYHGVTSDPTPNENYTVQGVTSGKPTPETSAKQAAKVKAYQADLIRPAGEDK